jgi:hypothetical protein
VVAGDERQHLALGHGQPGHRVRAGDGEPARPRRPAQVAEVDQPADEPIIADEHVVLVRIVVDRLRGQRAQRRLDLLDEALEHRVGDSSAVGCRAACVRPQLAGAQQVPRERPVQRRVVEVRQRRIEPRDRAAQARKRLRVRLVQLRPRRPGHPGEHARDAIAGRHPRGAVPAADDPRRRHAGAPRDVRHRRVLEVEPRRIGVPRVELEHVAVEREVAVELARQLPRPPLEAEALARDLLGVLHRGARLPHVTDPSTPTASSSWASDRHGAGPSRSHSPRVSVSTPRPTSARSSWAARVERSAASSSATSGFAPASITGAASSSGMARGVKRRVCRG